MPGRRHACSAEPGLDDARSGLLEVGRVLRGFPYAWWEEFRRIEDLGAEVLDALPTGIALTPQYADVTDQIEKKITGITIYESQIERLFDGSREMADAVRSHARIIAEIGGIDGLAERYWVSERV